MRQQQPTKTPIRRFWVGLALFTMALSDCSIGLQRTLNSEKAQMEKLPTFDQWSDQINAADERLLAYYRHTYPSIQWSTQQKGGGATCALTDLRDIGASLVTITGTSDWTREDWGTNPKHLPSGPLLPALLTYFGPLGFHVTVAQGQRFPTQVSGPGGATVGLEDHGANGLLLEVDAGCRLFSHNNPDAPATKN